MVWLLLIYIVGGFFSYGLTLGSLTDEFPHMENFKLSLGFALTGPICAFIVPLVTGRIKFRVIPLTKEQRWEEFKKGGFEILGRDYFEQRHG